MIQHLSIQSLSIPARLNIECPRVKRCTDKLRQLVNYQLIPAASTSHSLRLSSRTRQSNSVLRTDFSEYKELHFRDVSQFFETTLFEDHEWLYFGDTIHMYFYARYVDQGLLLVTTYEFYISFQSE